jgi:hypothetical protein
MTLKLHSRTPSLLQDSTSLPATAEFGFKTRHAFVADILYIDRPLFINNAVCAVSEMEALIH